MSPDSQTAGGLGLLDCGEVLAERVFDQGDLL